MSTAENISTRQIKAARALLAWSQVDLAARANLSLGTVEQLEAPDGLLDDRSDEAAKIVHALAAAGIEFSNGREPGVRLRSLTDEAIPFEQLNAANDE